MKQHVNLYKNLSRPTLQHFSEKVIFRIAAGFTVLLMITTFLQGLNWVYQQHVVDSLQKQYNIDSASLIKKSQSGNNTVSLQHELLLKQQTLKAFHVPIISGQCEGPSYYFDSLVNAKVEGLWLTRFHIDAGSGAFVFNGMTYEPTLILQWLKALGQTTCFSGVKFKSIQMTKSHDVPEAEASSFMVSAQPLVGGLPNGKA